MCDEYEQKLDRLKALDKKVEELKLKQGEFNLSGTVRSITIIVYMMYTCTCIHHGSPDAGCCALGDFIHNI